MVSTKIPDQTYQIKPQITVAKCQTKQMDSDSRFKK